METIYTFKIDETFYSKEYWNLKALTEQLLDVLDAKDNYYNITISKVVKNE